VILGLGAWSALGENIGEKNRKNDKFVYSEKNQYLRPTVMSFYF